MTPRTLQYGQRAGRMARVQATPNHQTSGAITSIKEGADQFQSGQTLHAVSPRPRITLTIEPDFERTTDFMRWLIGEARAWEAKDKEGCIT